MIHVLIAGPQCARCDEAEQRLRQVVEEGGLDSRIERVSDFSSIIALQVYAVPGLMVDGALKSVGRVPERAELVHWLGHQSQQTTLQSGPMLITEALPKRK